MTNPDGPNTSYAVTCGENISPTMFDHVDRQRVLTNGQTTPAQCTVTNLGLFLYLWQFGVHGILIPHLAEVR